MPKIPEMQTPKPEDFNREIMRKILNQNAAILAMNETIMESLKPPVVYSGHRPGEVVFSQGDPDHD
ncbi:MAG: hypothetical protein VX464_20735 [Pseudomonadota bacterium]|nr:hypothetical protein [Pseudomonadota bacterium]